MVILKIGFLWAFCVFNFNQNKRNEQPDSAAHFSVFNFVCPDSTAKFFSADLNKDSLVQMTGLEPAPSNPD